MTQSRLQQRMRDHCFGVEQLLSIVLLLEVATLRLGCWAQQQPTISYISPQKVAAIGDTVDLDCSVQYAYDYPVQWVKTTSDFPQEAVYISSGSTQIVPDQRFSIRHDETTSSYTLQITKLQETDGGIYQCRVVTSPTNVITADSRLYIRTPPIISDNSTRSVITSTGQNVTLECYARGQPKPRITWRRENNNLLPTGGAVYRGSALRIFNVTKDDRGTYYCIADNKVGQGARRNIGVEVEFRPVVKADRERNGQALQYPMDLQCHIEAFPAPSIVWLKDGYQLSDNQHYKISIFSTEHEFTDTILRVISIEKKQYGNYTCRAINKLGMDEKMIQLYETPNVICPPACDAQYLGSSGSLHPDSSLVLFFATGLLLTLLSFTIDNTKTATWSKSPSSSQYLKQR